MKVLHSVQTLQPVLQDYRRAKQSIALVPTMGGLHAGHLSLVELAKQQADKVLLSIFVNPAQFAAHEDFDIYPRGLQQDLAQLQTHQVDAVFAPSNEEIYPNGIDETFDIGAIGRALCGKTRPHFFSGVVQVVRRLFAIVKPDMAVFGEKDYQQLHIIKRLTTGVEILPGGTVREPDGLAMSTRNQYLSNDERKIAPQLYRILTKLAHGKLTKNQAEQALQQYFKLDYLSVLDADTLEKISTKTTRVALLCAVFLGSNRLIDNIIFPVESKAFDLSGVQS